MSEPSPAETGAAPRSSRIVHVTNVHLWRDTRIFLKMCRSLAAAGYETHLVALDREATEPRDIEEAGVHIALRPGADISGRLNRATKGARRVVAHALSLRPDAVHLHDPELIPWIPYFRMRGVKVIFDAHEDFVAQNDSREWASGWRKLPLRAVATGLRTTVNLSATRILTATEAIAERHPRNRTTVVNNYPILGELAQPDSAGSVPLSSRPMRGIYVGGINGIRGLREVVRALAAAPNVEGLDLVGGFQSPEFHDELKALPGWEKVTYHGQCDRGRVAELMAGVRFGVVTFHPLSNHIDAKPNKLFEYLSAGLPVVHSDFPLWRGITGAPRLGRACDPLDPGSVAAAMESIVTDPGLDAISEQARDIIETQYNWNAEFGRLDRIVEGMLTKQGPSSLPNAPVVSG